MALNFLNNGYFAGKVGIGIASPGAKLHLSGTGVTELRIASTTANTNSLLSFYEGSLASWGIDAGQASGNFFIKDLYNSATRLTINPSGNVGIGTTSPDTLLDLEKDGAHLTISDTTLANAHAGDTQSQLTFKGQYYSGSSDLRFSQARLRLVKEATDGTAGSGLAFDVTNEAGGLSVLTERVRIDKSGNVGIGTTSPGAKLDVSGGITADYFRTDTTTYDWSLISRNSVSNASLYVQAQQSATNQWIARFNYGNAIANGGDNVLTVAKDNSYFLNTNVGIGTTSPDAKLDVSQTTTGIGAIIGNTTHNSQLQIYTAAAGKNSEIWFGDAGDADVGKIDYDHANDSMSFFIGATKRLSFDSAGTMLLGDTATAYQTIFFDPTPSTVYGNGTLQIQPTTSPGSGIAQFTTNFADRVGGGTTKHNVRVGGTVTATDFIGGSGAYLPLAGGTMTGNIVMSNNTELRWEDSVGTEQRILELVSSDLLELAWDQAELELTPEVVLLLIYLVVIIQNIQCLAFIHSLMLVRSKPLELMVVAT